MEAGGKFRVSKCGLACIGWIGEVLLYSAWDYVRFPEIKCSDKEYEDNVCACPGHLAAQQQKGRRRCKSAAPQQEKPAQSRAWRRGFKRILYQIHLYAWLLRQWIYKRRYSSRNPLKNHVYIPSGEIWAFLLLRYISWKETVAHACLVCGAVLGHSVVSNSWWPHGPQPARLLGPRDSPDQNTGVGCHFFFQGIFLTQGSNLHFLHCSHPGSPWG